MSQSVTLVATQKAAKDEMVAEVVSENNTSMMLKLQNRLGLTKFDKKTGMEWKKENSFPGWKIKQ